MTRIIDKDGVPLEDPADVASEAVEWIERQLRSGLMTDTPEDDAKVRALLARDKARGEEIERLKHDVTSLMAAANSEANDVEAQTLRIKALEEALKPFATVGRLIDGPYGPRGGGGTPDGGAFVSGAGWRVNGEAKTLTWGDFRRARAALTAKEDTDHG